MKILKLLKLSRMRKPSVLEQSPFDTRGAHQTSDTVHHIPVALTEASDDGVYTVEIDSDTYSTNWTCDDIPGTGRIIDKYVYQLLGRKLEMLMTRLPVNHQQEMNYEAMLSVTDGEKEDQQPEEDQIIYDDTADSQSAIYSDSTMATTNNNPGTGRTLDTHFFQPLGKLTERTISRVLLRTLPLAFPAERIISRVIKIHDDLNIVKGVSVYPLKFFIDYTKEVGIEWTLPGLFALVKQCS